MKKLFYISLFIVLFCLAANAQVEIKQETADRAARCFIESEAKTDLIRAQDAEIAALKREVKTTESLVEAERAISRLKDEQLEIYRKLKCPVVSIFFRIYKKRSCF